MINIAVLGYGNIGGGVVDIIEQNSKYISDRTGQEVNVKYIIDIRDFKGHKYESKIIKDFNIALNDPEVSIVVEAIGGSHPAYDFTLASLKVGKSVVSSNKETVANFGAELLRVAKENNVKYLFEASVGGGIPIIRPLATSLAGNAVERIDGILNGTSNYILTQMERRGISMEEALKEAQANGYAEANPSADIEGTDSCRKICILAAMAYGVIIPYETVPTKGITDVTAEMIAEAKKNGKRIRLIATAEMSEDGKPSLSVAPREITEDNPLYNISDVFNGILVRGNAVGDVMFYGRGAGAMPTASAVLADIIDVITDDGVAPVWHTL